MPDLPDLTDPRYLYEVGWFVVHEHYLKGESYDDQRRRDSQVWLEEVLRSCHVDEDWLRSRAVLTIGCGCTGDLATWPAAAKIAVDPILYTYQQLDMLLIDDPGTAPTVFLNAGAEDLLLTDDAASLVVCRNALDHMIHPDRALDEMARVDIDDGFVVCSVDIGGEPTPDEPSVFASVDDLRELVERSLEVVRIEEAGEPHSKQRIMRVIVVARRSQPAQRRLSREQVRHAYEQCAREEGWGW